MVPSGVELALFDAVRQAEQTGYRTVGIYSGALGYVYNSAELARRKLAADMPGLSLSVHAASEFTTSPKALDELGLPRVDYTPLLTPPK